MNDGYRTVVGAAERDRLNLFLSTAGRMGTPVQNVEKDFWVCWVLDALFHDRDERSPRLLFKGGTSLSKAFKLIPRFSEDIDITVFRADLGQDASVEDLEAVSGKKRRARLEAIRDACRRFVTGSLAQRLTAAAQSLLGPARSTRPWFAVDPQDPDGQTLLFWYPSVTEVC